MKIKYIILFLLVIFSYFKTYTEVKSDFIKIDFDSSMGFESNKLNIYKHLSKSFFARLNLFKLIYEKNEPSKIQISNSLRIPKKIHQIWLGGSMPEKFHRISQVWKQMHPDWEYFLWTDENIQELFPLYNQRFFNESKNLGERSDILRYEILYKFGGLYVDVDFECVKPFDVLSFMYDFYAGIEPLDASPLVVGNAFFASKAEHPILEHCIDNIKNFRDKKNVTDRTGPWHLTRSIINYCKHYKEDIMIFPTSFLYPISYFQTKSLDKIVLNQETFGIHYWAGTWHE